MHVGLPPLLQAYPLTHTYVAEHCCVTCSDKPAGSSTDQAAQPGPRPLSAGSYGWELSPSLTAPVVGHVSGHEVRFGEEGLCQSIGRG
jgi:hypothetical protein